MLLLYFGEISGNKIQADASILPCMSLNLNVVLSHGHFALCFNLFAKIEKRNENTKPFEEYLTISKRTEQY